MFHETSKTKSGTDPQTTESKQDNKDLSSPWRVLSETEETARIMADSGNNPKKPADTSTISNSESSSQINGESEEKHKKENLNPGEAESVMKYKAGPTSGRSESLCPEQVPVGQSPEIPEETTNPSEVLDPFHETSEVWEPFPKASEVLESHIQAKKFSLGASRSASDEQKFGREEKEREPRPQCYQSV